MDTLDVYSAKAAHYARHRWDYHAAAIQTIIDIAQITLSSHIADIGAGTGVLTRHFAPLVAQLYVVEPNTPMRRQAQRALVEFPSCIMCAGRAEDTGLPAASIDVIMVAQAIHWFEPTPARSEFHRILRPGGWLAIIRNTRTEDTLEQATQCLFTPEYGIKQAVTARLHDTAPPPFFYGDGTWQRLTFPFTSQIDLAGYLGALHSVAATPDEDDEHYPRLIHAARQVFQQCSVDGKCTIHGETELYIGQPYMA